MTGVTTIQFPKFEEENGCLCVFECGQRVPFLVHRVFTISARMGDIRGEHAHKKCSQLLVSLSGKILVICDDGTVKSEHHLDGMGSGILIPPGVWAVQKYLADDAILMVLCDRGYEAEDYIRDYVEFKTLMAMKGSS